MIDLIANALNWLATHGPTVSALALVFILGVGWGMWIQFSNDAHEKSPQSAGTR